MKIKLISFKNSSQAYFQRNDAENSSKIRAPTFPYWRDPSSFQVNPINHPFYLFFLIIMSFRSIESVKIIRWIIHKQITTVGTKWNGIKGWSIGWKIDRSLGFCSQGKWQYVCSFSHGSKTTARGNFRSRHLACKTSIDPSCEKSFHPTFPWMERAFPPVFSCFRERK